MWQGRGYKKLVYLIGVLMIMLLIFAFSAQTSTASKALSNQFITTYNQVVPKIPLPLEVKTKLLSRPGYYIRKGAHMTIYAVLGVLLLMVLWQMPIKKGLSPIISYFLCTMYAITDEWHQYYVEGRGAQISDIIIDSIGALVGIICIQIMVKVFRGNSEK